MNMNLKDAKNIKNVQIIRKTMNVIRLLEKKLKRLDRNFKEMLPKML
jgi:hypothetical protein